MKKLLTAVLFVALLSIGISVSANNKFATVINDNGHKLVIAVGSKVPFGYHLMITQKVGGSSPYATAYINSNVIGTKTTPATGAQTVAFGTGLDYDYVFLNAKITAATTTAQTYTITPYFSNSNGCSSSTDSNVDWYSQGVQTASGTVSTSTQPLSYNFSTSATSSNMFQIIITPVGSACMKLVTTTTNASTTAWVEALIKQR